LQGGKVKPIELKNYIEHTNLKPESGLSVIKNLAFEAVDNNFFGICVNNCFVAEAKQFLKGSSVKLVTVVGFPLGTVDKRAKAYEAELAIKNGADEIDMVINIGALKDQRNDYVLDDIKKVVESSNGSLIKVIIETGLLTEEEKIRACKIADESVAHFVKTCTGFNPGKATVSDIQLMKSAVNGRLGIKASGGIKDFKSAKELIDAGDTRLGTSSGIALISGEQGIGGF
jgi:deoxyribose-phosphate aldolase